MLHGVRTYILQSKTGQIVETHSISAGLDYPGVGPEHAWLKDTNRAEYVVATDEEALRGFRMLTQCEGIIPGAFSLYLFEETSAKLYVSCSFGVLSRYLGGCKARQDSTQRPGHRCCAYYYPNAIKLFY